MDDGPLKGVNLVLLKDKDLDLDFDSNRLEVREIKDQGQGLPRDWQASSHDACRQAGQSQG